MNGFYFQTDYWDAACTLPEKQRDKFIAAIVRYYFTEEEPQLKGAMLAAFMLLKKRIDIGRKRAVSGALGGKQKPSKTQANFDFATTSSDKQNASTRSHREKENEIKEILSYESTKKRFNPPSLQEVEAYIKEKGFSIDAQHFIDYYAQQGWKLSNGNAMKDWKAAVRNWNHRGRSDSTPFDYGEVEAW